MRFLQRAVRKASPNLVLAFGGLEAEARSGAPGGEKGHRNNIASRACQEAQAAVSAY